MKRKIDINCDLGESENEMSFLRELELLPHIHTANICCGFHGGKPDYIERIIDEAISQNIAIGAHPSLPDKAGFGRRYMKIPKHELRSLIIIQMNLIRQHLIPRKMKLNHVKPHGALYHSVMNGKEDAEALIEAVLNVNPSMAIMGMPGTPLEEMAHQAGIKYIREGFADRLYNGDGTLAKRTDENAILTEVEDALLQTMMMIVNKKVRSKTFTLDLEVDSICIHGDNPSAKLILEAVAKELMLNEPNKKPER